MEIHALRASINEQDLNDLLSKHLPADQPVEDIKIHIAADGVHVSGVYPMFVNVAFETHWQVGVNAGKLTAQLAGLKAMGIGGNIFKSAILKLIAESARRENWLQLEQDTLTIDVDKFLLNQGLRARTNLSKISCEPGVLVLEC